MDREERECGPDKSGCDISDSILWCVGFGVAFYIALGFFDPSQKTPSKDVTVQTDSK